MFALLLLLQAASPDIIVTGERLVEEQAKCARGECTPLRDAQATIALAEQRFRNGEYVHAKGLLAAAISRNKDRGRRPRARWPPSMKRWRRCHCMRATRMIIAAR
ncbi:hypothetical protein ACFSUK_34365 [Sphingobium scionense]